VGGEAQVGHARRSYGYPEGSPTDRYRFLVPTAAELRERLDDIGEALADLAMDALRAALEDGDDEAKQRERRLTRARRSVEKAAALLADREPDPDLDG
jgi:hypothetical protein